MLKTAFVAGATGYTGQAVVAVLRAEGVETLAHIRPGSSSLDAKTQQFKALGAKVVTPAWALKPLAQLLSERRPDAVFALLGTTRKRAKGEGRTASEAYEAVDYGLTRLLMDACLKAEISPRFVYLSCMGADADSPSPYIAVRGRFEAELKASGLPYTIAQPGFITGEDREDARPMERVGAVVSDTSLALIRALGGKDLADRYSSMDAQTLAQTLCRAAAAPECAGKTLDPLNLRRLL